MWFEIGCAIVSSGCAIGGGVMYLNEVSPKRLVKVVGSKMSRRNRYDMTKNRKLVKYDRDRHRWRLEAEDHWFESWVYLMGSQAELGYWEQHRLETAVSDDVKRKIRREAERARIAEIIYAHEQAKRTMAKVLAEKAQREIDWKKKAIKLKVEQKRQKWETDYRA